MFGRKLNISPENKVHFWSIFTTGVVGLFSLWLGISIQDDINTKNARETQKLARYQMVEAVYPKFSQYIDTGGYVFFDLLEIANTSKDNAIIETIGNYYIHEQIPFIETMKNSVNFMCDNRYYFGKDAQERICENNTSILFGLRLLEHDNEFLNRMTKTWNDDNIEDYVGMELSSSYYAKNVFSFRQQTAEKLQERCKVFLDDINKKKTDTNFVANNAVYQFIFLPYIDNFNVYSQELVPNDDVTSHIWKHILILVGCILLSLLMCVMLLRYVFNVNMTIKQK